jgi:environmental stress-induced protein Ves
MQILRAANYNVMPWKNGLGSTTEIAISPASDGLSDFDWRVSMAQVTSDGPFSSFPGIDRTLMILDGDGIILTVADRASVRLDRSSIHAFPGDQPTSAVLTDGAIVDLNVMSRRDCMQHHVQRIKVMESQHFQVSSLTLLFVERGTLAVRCDGVSDVLAERDTLLIDCHTSSVTLESAEIADLIAIEFRDKDTTSPSILMAS